MRLRTGLCGTLFYLLLTGCSTDMLPFSSGAVNGAILEAPGRWNDAASVEVVQLETRPSDPYSVNLWVIGEGERLYVFAGGSKANWVEHIEADPNVRLKMGDGVYLLKAERVNDPDEFEWFAGQWKNKYGRRPWNEDVTETYLMRLVPRTP